MNENRPSQLMFTLINGIYLGLALIVFSMVLYLLGVDLQSSIQYISYVIMIGLTFMFVKQWRDKHNDGFLTYGQAFSNSFLIILFASLLTGLYTFVFFQVIAPGEIAVMLEKAETDLYDKGMSDNEIEMGMEYTAMFMKPWIMAIMGIFASIIGGLIVSAILAVFVKNEPKEFI